ncbi:hypothetical protein ACFX13_036041 [Malus domestica]
MRSCRIRQRCIQNFSSRWGGRGSRDRRIVSELVVGYQLKDNSLFVISNACVSRQFPGVRRITFSMFELHWSLENIEVGFNATGLRNEACNMIKRAIVLWVSHGGLVK